MNVLVVGGYGAVGVHVVKTLAGWFPGRVVPAGRDLAKASRLAEAIAATDGGGSAGTAGGAAARVDVTDADGFARVLEQHQIGVVVLCVEPPDATVARVCLGQGVHLVDVGASYRLLAQVEGLKTAEATAVLSVGVAPGLTNLLARRAHDALGGADRIDLTVLLGAGERHGADAVRWTVGQLATRPDGAPLRVELPGFGTRTAHPFPFSDQHTLRRTLGVPVVTTRLCLDSAPLTAGLFALSGAARHAQVRRALTAVLSRVHMGGDRFAVRADAYLGDRRAAYALAGREQSRYTGLVAAHVTRALLDGRLPPGVHHLDQLPALASVPEDLGLRVENALEFNRISF
ncbi:saccharopine dehydrogenase NADP-binding domain-containing protein [Nonomuraea basaltis]|uniref:saccharopine dehydrogenase NADP-binding domain-containing protein n=1 Tax=Nonomuraea basaltis TaxID=2495887 RepID=UPI00197E5B7C|nr:saccharopine dehydrogenase NADP-binding domain-containing protein [Nonomuraea basaltis]